MKRMFLLLLMFGCICRTYSQTTGYIRNDTIKLTNANKTTTVFLEAAGKGHDWYLKDIGNGRLQFVQATIDDIDHLHDSLLVKANDTNVVHKTGNETVRGIKTYADQLNVLTSVAMPGQAFVSNSSIAETRFYYPRPPGNDAGHALTYHADGSGLLTYGKYYNFGTPPAGNGIFRVLGTLQNYNQPINPYDVVNRRGLDSLLLNKPDSANIADNYLNKSGGILTGDLQLTTTPLTNNSAITKIYSDSSVAKANALLSFKSAPASSILSNPVVSLSTVNISTTAPTLTGYTDQVFNTPFTANTTAGSNIITVSSATGLTVGKPLIEQGTTVVAPTTIPLGTVITAISGTTVTMSNAALTTASALGIYAWSAKVNLIGGFPFRYGSAFTAGSASITSANPSIATNAYALEFLTDAANISTTTTAFIINLFANGGPGTYLMAIDDHYQTSSPVSYGTSSSAWISVTLPTPGVHKIRLEFTGATTIGHLYAINGASFIPPKPSQNVRVAMYSDSYFASALAMPGNLGYLIPAILGWTPDILSVGGTGYVNNGTVNYNWADTHRLDDFKNRVYDAVIIQGSVNDAGSGASTIQTNALTTFQGIRSRQPNATIFVFGCMTTTNLSAANATTVENAIHAAFAAWGDHNAYFIPITTDPNGGWITSANTSTYIGSDGTHPNAVGQLYLAQRYANAILDILKAQQVFVPKIDDQALSTVTNSTTSALSSPTLSSTYPLAPIGLRVICESISGGPIIYTKGASGWLSMPATAVP